MAVKTIAIVHHTHTDFGYTDHSERTKKQQVKYVDLAVEYVLKSSHYPEGARFAWTLEVGYAVRQWWQQANDEKKQRFMEALATGRLEVTGLPFNVTAFMSREEWETALHWLPEDLWEKAKVRTAMQNDVNGMHTPGMEMAWDRGVKTLWIGPNSYYGAPPMPTPTAFHWEIAPGKKMFVWLNAGYDNGVFMFNPNWREGPVPNVADLRYREPEAGDIWAADEASVRAAHKRCLECLAEIEGTGKSADDSNGPTKSQISGGYKWETLPVSVTSLWRMDNDPPFYHLVDFVAKWNELGLQPRLELCTAGCAIDKIKEEAGEELPTYTGQWIDWWANGNASAPVEMAANREAKRTLRTAALPLFGELTEEQNRILWEAWENVCMYDEHCFSSWASVSNPYSTYNLSQAAEKNCYVYRALDDAQCLLAERARALTKDDKNKIVVFNPGEKEMTAFVELPVNCMRGEYASVYCEETGALLPLEYRDGVANFVRPQSPDEFGPENVSRTFSDKAERQAVRFGPVNIPPMGCLHFVPGKEPAAAEPFCGEVTVKTDANGWPVLVYFPGQSAPAVDGAFGELLSVEADGFSPRWTFRDIFHDPDEAARARMCEEHLREVPAVCGAAVCTEENGVLCYEQPLAHPAAVYARRVMTVDLHTKTVKFELRMNRRSDFAPEVIFLRFDAPGEDTLPCISNAGAVFKPEEEQLPGSCMDFYAVDGWLHYPGGWLLNSTDAALVTFGETGVVRRKTKRTGPANRIYMRLFDNVWDTNFTANACGQMNFRFAACADVPVQQAETAARSLETEPVVVVKMGYK